MFSRKVLIEDTIFAFPTGDGTAILRGHLSHAKVLPFNCSRAKAVPSFLSSLMGIGPWESNLRPAALQLSALPTELNRPAAMLKWPFNQVER